MRVVAPIRLSIRLCGFAVLLLNMAILSFTPASRFAPP
jgi:hypothetical protein